MRGGKSENLCQPALEGTAADISIEAGAARLHRDDTHAKRATRISGSQHEFSAVYHGQPGLIPNYGERWRNAEATDFVESASVSDLPNASRCALLQNADLGSQ